jgi:hypothetical protein
MKRNLFINVYIAIGGAFMVVMVTEWLLITILQKV